MRSISLHSQKGIALTIAIIFIIATMGIIALLLNMSFDYRSLSDRVSSTKLKAFYAAQAGIVDAYWRIRTNTTSDWGGGLSFANSGWDPPVYFLDMGANPPTFSLTQQPGSDVRIDIGLPDASGVRAMAAKGFD